ncbi:hypothetical protein Trydic_g19296 [Trypoxylus dichotomus]
MNHFLIGYCIQILNIRIIGCRLLRFDTKQFQGFLAPKQDFVLCLVDGNWNSPFLEKASNHHYEVVLPITLENTSSTSPKVSQSRKSGILTR